MILFGMALHLAFLALLLPLALACGYLLALTLLSRRGRSPMPYSHGLRFDLIVPAHDEAPVIQRVVTSLARLDWPAQNFRILVICDNCSDATAALARAAGAVVLERNDPALRGKGYALRFGFEASLGEGWADAVVVVDADSEVSPNLLQACAARIERGAGAVQAHYGVLNPQASVRTRLMTLAFACIHPLRSRARERLGLSCGVRGNGWCLTHELLWRVPYTAYTLAEDVEYGIELGLAGWRVHYADEAEVLGEMVSGEKAARSQRRRWEGGRTALLRSHLPRLLAAALQRPCGICLDLAADLLLPALSWLVLGVLALLPAVALAGALDPAYGLWLRLDLACLLCLLLYVARGWQISGLGRQGLADLLRVPGFILWKLRLTLAAERRMPWIRTQREQS